jgi:hypothetical protein
MNKADNKQTLQIKDDSLISSSQVERLTGPYQIHTANHNHPPPCQVLSKNDIHYEQSSGNNCRFPLDIKRREIGVEKLTREKLSFVNNQNALLRMYIYLLSSLNMNTQNK